MGSSVRELGSEDLCEMDDGEIDFSNQDIFSEPGFSVDPLPGEGCFLEDGLFEEFLKDTHACTHTHTCNPPGPDHAHMHTCFHVHTKIVPAPEDEKTNASDDTEESVDKSSVRSKKRPAGNREAVRKYREKKKAHAASLEHELLQLRARVQHLTMMLQGKAALEAENVRLKSLLVDIRGRIEGEIGSFPYQKGRNEKPASEGVSAKLDGGYALNPCNLQCGGDVSCFGPGFPAKSSDQGLGMCDIGNVQCQAFGSASAIKSTTEFLECIYGNLGPNPASAIANKKKRGARGG